MILRAVALSVDVIVVVVEDVIAFNVCFGALFSKISTEEMSIPGWLLP